MMPLMTAAGWAAQLHRRWSACRGFAQLSPQRCTRCTMARHNNGTTAHGAHTQGTPWQSRGHAAAAARSRRRTSARCRHTRVLSCQLYHLSKINKGGEAEAGKWWKKKVKVERKHAEINGEFAQCFFWSNSPNELDVDTKAANLNVGRRIFSAVGRPNLFCDKF